jgi:hypothetical protein
LVPTLLDGLHGDPLGRRPWDSLEFGSGTPAEIVEYSADDANATDDELSPLQQWALDFGMNRDRYKQEMAAGRFYYEYFYADGTIKHMRPHQEPFSRKPFRSFARIASERRRRR